MTTRFVRRSAPLFTLVTVVGLLSACEDARVKAVDTGMTRDQAITQLAKDAKGGGPDSMPNVYKREEYLIDSRKYEVLYFTEHNEKANRDTVAFSDLTPIVLIDNRVVGKGWPYWDSVSTANKIPLRKH